MCPPFLLPYGRKILKRLLSGFLLIPLVLVIVLYASAFWLTLTISLITVLALWEFCSITSTTGAVGWKIPAVVFGAALPLVLYMEGTDAVLPYLVGALFFFFVYGISFGREFAGTFNWVVSSIAGVVYIALPLACLVLLAGMEHGRLWMIFVFTIIWSNDTFAYYTGKNLGRHMLAPRISPKKTVEGAVGGLAGCVAATYTFNRFLGMGFSTVEVVVVSLVLGVVSIAGDLAESMIKRSAGVKDSGSIIPGHGGMLDRIDSVLFAVPALYYYLLWRNTMI